MCSKKFGWSDNNGILVITPDAARPNFVKNLLDENGTITYEAMMAKELTYIDTDCRETQDTHTRYECITNSLTDERRTSSTSMITCILLGRMKKYLEPVY